MIYFIMIFSFENGFMGEFAKNTITEVYDFLKLPISNANLPKTNDNWTSKRCQDLINVIGEPLIKERLQLLYNSKYPPNKELLLSKMKEIQLKLDELAR